MYFEGTYNTDVLNVSLKQQLLPILNPGQALIFDNASFYKSARTQKLVESYGCKIVFLPPYVPELARSKPY